MGIHVCFFLSIFFFSLFFFFSSVLFFFVLCSLRNPLARRSGDSKIPRDMKRKCTIDLRDSKNSNSNRVVLVLVISHVWLRVL